jgi:hypothetical protein
MNNGKRKFADGKFAKSIIVVAGIVLGQAVLYGPSLIGQKILLPLDILAYPNVYLPQTPATAGIVPHNIVLSDLVYQFEPDRHYANSELYHGRFPLWAPYQYGGVPFVWPKFSPFLFLESCIRSPVILAWTQLLAALVAGTGMFFFCRKSLSVGFWPATVCAWCYPRLSHRPGSLLAALVITFGCQNGSWRVLLGALGVKCRDLFGPGQRTY